MVVITTSFHISRIQHMPTPYSIPNILQIEYNVLCAVHRFVMIRFDRIANKRLKINAEKEIKISTLNTNTQMRAV